MEQKLHRLRELLGEIDDLNRAAAVLSWDQQTYMPSAGVAGRAAQLATLRTIAHARFVGAEMGTLLDALRPYGEQLDFDSDAASLIRVTAREYEKARKIPEKFVAEFTQKASMGFTAWEKAREINNFLQFRPFLEEVVALTRQKAEYLGYTDHIYDPLLDAFEAGMKTTEVVAIFDILKRDLQPLVRHVIERQASVKNTVFQGTFDVDHQWTFTIDILKQIGYDFTRGRQDRSAHPFSTSFGLDDVRITTRFNPELFTSAIFSSIHEFGHALYEMNISRSLTRTIICDGASSAIHESQSRFWENVIGRSRAFWTYFMPKLQALYPEKLANATLEQAYQSANIATPSFIRVEADELTYCFHIFLRFDLEIGLMTGSIAVKDLPEIWNAKMQEYLGITPPNDTLGVLQDVHWSEGLFGYFPTYALGSMLSAQFYACILKDMPNLNDLIARGDFAPLRQWLQTHIHTHGAKFLSKDLVKRVTGEPMNPQPFITYLNTKYREIYR